MSEYKYQNRCYHLDWLTVQGVVPALFWRWPWKSWRKCMHLLYPFVEGDPTAELGILETCAKGVPVLLGTSPMPYVPSWSAETRKSLRQLFLRCWLLRIDRVLIINWMLSKAGCCDCLHCLTKSGEDWDQVAFSTPFCFVLSLSLPLYCSFRLFCFFFRF